MLLALLVRSVPAAQTVDDRAVRDRLNRIGADLFSAAPHTADDIRELKEVLAVAPDVADAHLLLGIAYRAQGSSSLTADAVAELRQALALKPDLVLARVTLARVYLDMARTSRARDELDVALEQVPGNPQVQSLLGEAERQLGNAARSEELNRQALKADPSFVQARYYLALALSDLGRHDEAIRELQLVVESGTHAAEANLALGTAYLDAGRANDAVAVLREARRLDPSRPETHIRLARAYRIKRLLADASKELELARPSSTGGSEAVYRGTEWEFYMEEGLVRLQQGRLEAAAASFERVLAINPEDAAAKEKLAEVRKRIRHRPPKKIPGPQS